MASVVVPYGSKGGWYRNGQRNFAVMTQYIFGAQNRVSYVFPAAPIEVSVESLASEYEEIARPGNFPLLNFKALPLNKASIQFRVFDKPSGGEAPITAQLQLLRNMALNPMPVYFQNVDQLLQNPSGNPNYNKLFEAYRGNANIFWRISDMSINVLRRNIGGGPSSFQTFQQFLNTSFTDSEATQADVSMSLIEERNPIIPLVLLPRISYTYTPPRSGGSTSGGAPAITYGQVSPIKP